MKITRIVLSIIISTVFMTFAISCGDEEDDNKVSPPNSQTTEVNNDNAGVQRDSTVVQRDDVITDGIKMLILVFNQQPVSVSYGGKTGSIVANPDGTWEVVFVETSSSGKLAVDFGAGFDKYQENISFGSADAIERSITPKRNSSQISYTVNDPTAPKDGDGNMIVKNDNANQNDKQFGTSKNDTEAAELSKVEADMVVPPIIRQMDGSTIPTGSEFSIIVFTPTQEEVAVENTELTENKQVEEKVLGVKCQPDGIAFDNPVQLTVNIPWAEGYDLKLKHEASHEEVYVTPVSGTDMFQANIPHFSSWIYYLNAKIVKISSETILIDEGNITIQNSGKQRITFKKYVGYEVIGNPHPIVKQYLAGVFGVKKRQIQSAFSFTAPSEGTATWLISQTVHTYDFRSGVKKFQVRFYSKVVPSVVFRVYGEDTGEPIHNGGDI